MSWVKEDQVLNNTVLYHLESFEDTHCFEIKDTEPEDSGVYTCIAENTEGKATCNIPLIINGKRNTGTIFSHCTSS